VYHYSFHFNLAANFFFSTLERKRKLDPGPKDLDSWKYMIEVQGPHCLSFFNKKNDRNTSGLQQMYNSPLTWDGPHILWGPPHVRGLLYICCKPGVRESVLFQQSPGEIENLTGKLSA
jgi:hypothetical protein